METKKKKKSVSLGLSLSLPSAFVFVHLYLTTEVQFSLQLSIFNTTTTTTTFTPHCCCFISFTISDGVKSPGRPQLLSLDQPSYRRCTFAKLERRETMTGSSVQNLNYTSPAFPSCVRNTLPQDTLTLTDTHRRRRGLKSLKIVRSPCLPNVKVIKRECFTWRAPVRG